MEKETNAKEIVYYMFIFCLLFTIKQLLSFILSKQKVSKESTTENKPISEEEKLENEINNLKKEAEKYDNPSGFVTFTKINRQIIKLEKDLENIKKIKPQFHTMKNSNRSSFNFKELISINMFSIYFEICFWVINILIYFYITKETHLILPYEKYKDNILAEYYHNFENNKVEIPIKLIFICESFALNQFKNFCLNFFSLKANNYK